MSEQPDAPPKALAMVAGRPLIERVMDVYRDSGYNRFLVATGHKHESIHRHFEQDESLGTMGVSCVYTGETTKNAGRLKQLEKYINDDTFMMTWTDGIADIDVRALVAFHRQHGKLATLTAVQLPPRFGHVALTDSGEVSAFVEKPNGREGWINGAFFVLQREVLDVIEGDSCEFERDVLASLAEAGELMAYRHPGMWRCADTPADLWQLEALDITTSLAGSSYNGQ